MPRTRPDQWKRRAFTLLEMTLVLAILVILGGLAVPEFRCMYADQNLSDAGDMLRGQWATARARAINDGVPYRFEVMWGEGKWRVAPDLPDSQNGNGQGNDEAAGQHVYTGQLPGNIRFTGGQDSSSDYSRLVTFYPDGTAQCYPPGGGSGDLILTLKADGTTSRNVITLRDLTGGVSSKWDSSGANAP